MNDVSLPCRDRAAALLRRVLARVTLDRRTQHLLARMQQLDEPFEACAYELAQQRTRQRGGASHRVAPGRTKLRNLGGGRRPLPARCGY